VPLSEEQLRGLIGAMENDRVERKSSASDMTKVSRTVCAFANDLPGSREPGVVFVGLKDDGTPSCLDITDKLLQKLAQIRSGGILPVPSIGISRLSLGEHAIAAIVVQPSSSPPVRYNGRVWVRIGPSTQQAGEEDERILRERALSQSENQPFDRRAARGANIEDLDIRYFNEEYLPSAVSPDVLAQNHRTLEQRLTSLRLLVGQAPSHGALILFGERPEDFAPGSFVQFLRIDGHELGDPIKDEKRLDGPLHRVIRQLDDLLELNISTRVDLTSAAREIRAPDYPLAALQQLVRNALMHRNYETSNAPVRVYWFRDRIEIHNPGGLFGQVTKDTFGGGITDYRNPLIAEMMATLGYVQRFGYGIPTARRLLKENLNPPPEFDFGSATNFLVTLRVRP